MSKLVSRLRRRTLLKSAADDVQGDAAWLDRFVKQRDEAAFTEIVRRHGTIALADILPDITDDVTISGLGTGVATIDGSGIAGGIAPLLTTSANVTLQFLTFANGTNTAGAGGAIRNTGDLTVNLSDFLNNAAVSGGAIANDGGSLTVFGATFTGNTATGAGGAVFTSGSASFANTTFTDNTAGGAGGAIASSSGTPAVMANLVVHNTLFLNNPALVAAGGAGGGIANDFGIATVTFSAFVGMRATGNGGAIANGPVGALAIADETGFVNNRGANGGAVYNAGLTTIDRTYIGSSNAVNGAGLYNENNGTLILAEVTMASNAASAAGGAVYSAGALRATNVTIAANSAVTGGGGIFNLLGFGSGMTFAGPGLPPVAPDLDGTLRNCIVSQNADGSGSPDIAGAVVSLGYNLVGNGTGAAGFVGSDQVGDALDPINAMLGVLQINGGTTPTFAPKPGSRAIGVGDPALVGTTDQTGRLRVGPVDVGAYALAPATRFVVTTPANASAGVPFDVTVTARDAIGNAGAYYGTVEFSSSDGLADLPASYTFTPGDHGVKTFSVTLRSNGGQTIHVVDADERTLLGDSPAIVVTGGAPQVLESSVAFLVNGELAPTAAGKIGVPVIVTGDFSAAGAGGTFTVTINWGDGTLADVLHLAADERTFISPEHFYNGDQTFYVTVTVTDDLTSLTSAPLEVVFNAYALPVEGIVISEPAHPGQSVSVESTVDTELGPLTISATLHRDAGVPDPAYIIVAVVPPTEPTLQIQVVQIIGGHVITTAFDVRTVNVNGHDYARVTFSYILLPGFPNTPTLSYLNPLVNALQPVLGSTQLFFDAHDNPLDPSTVPANGVIIDQAAQTITVTFDATSTPTLQNLKGTVFTITIPNPAGAVATPVRLPLAALQTNTPVGSANFISTPQLTLTLKVPQSVQTLTSPAALSRDIGPMLAAPPEVQGSEQAHQRALTIMSSCVRQYALTPLPDLSILFQKSLKETVLQGKISALFPEDDFWVRADRLNEEGGLALSLVPESEDLDDDALADDEAIRAVLLANDWYAPDLAVDAPLEGAPAEVVLAP